MIKKLTITVDEDVYRGLHKQIGRRKISHFITALVRPHVVNVSLSEAYRNMAQDEDRERAALTWAEATIGDTER